jgi:hypothetical protein
MARRASGRRRFPCVDVDDPGAGVGALRRCARDAALQLDAFDGVGRHVAQRRNIREPGAINKYQRTVSTREQDGALAVLRPDEARAPVTILGEVVLPGALSEEIPGVRRRRARDLVRADYIGAGSGARRAMARRSAASKRSGEEKTSDGDPTQLPHSTLREAAYHHRQPSPRHTQAPDKLAKLAQ